MDGKWLVQLKEAARLSISELFPVDCQEKLHP